MFDSDPGLIVAETQECKGIVVNNIGNRELFLPWGVGYQWRV
jgi:hypothetical protein